MSDIDATQRLARRSAIVGAGTMASRITGVVRVAITASVLGAAGLADTYNVANSTPNIVYELLLGGVLTAALVPVFVDAHAEHDDSATNAIFTVALTAVLLLTGIAMLLAPAITAALSSRVPPAQRAQAESVGTLLVALFLPQMIFYAYTALATAALNARRRFTAAAFAPVLNNVVVVIVLLAVRPSLPSCRTKRSDAFDACLDHAAHNHSVVFALGVGTTAGIVAMAAVLIPALHHAGVHTRITFAWRHRAVTRIARMSGWTVGYVVANQLAFAFVVALSRNRNGVFAEYTYAYTFFQLPHGLIAVSIMTAIAPQLATAARERDLPTLRREYTLGLRYLLLATVPAAALLIALARPIIDPVLHHGTFSSAAISDTARAVSGFAVGLVAFSAYLYTLRAFYSMSDARTPFIVNCVENGANVILALVLYPHFGVRGLALAFALAYALAALIAMILLYRRLGGFPLAPVGSLTARTIAAATLATLAALAIGRVAGGAIAPTVLAIAIAGVVYTFVLWGLRTPELGGLTSLMRKSGAPRV